jgi:hypothetical protein
MDREGEPELHFTSPYGRRSVFLQIGIILLLSVYQPGGTGIALPEERRHPVSGSPEKCPPGETRSPSAQVPDDPPVSPTPPPEGTDAVPRIEPIPPGYPSIPRFVPGMNEDPEMLQTTEGPRCVPYIPPLRCGDGNNPPPVITVKGDGNPAFPSFPSRRLNQMQRRAITPRSGMFRISHFLQS